MQKKKELSSSAHAILECCAAQSAHRLRPHQWTMISCKLERKRPNTCLKLVLHTDTAVRFPDTGPYKLHLSLNNSSTIATAEGDCHQYVGIGSNIRSSPERSKAGKDGGIRLNYSDARNAPVVRIICDKDERPTQESALLINRKSRSIMPHQEHSGVLILYIFRNRADARSSRRAVVMMRWETIRDIMVRRCNSPR